MRTIKRHRDDVNSAKEAKGIPYAGQKRLGGHPSCIVNSNASTTTAAFSEEGKAPFVSASRPQNRCFNYDTHGCSMCTTENREITRA